MDFRRGKHLVRLALEQNREENIGFADCKSSQTQSVPEKLDQVIEIPDRGILEYSNYNCTTEVAETLVDQIINDNSPEVLDTSHGCCANPSYPLATYTELQNVVDISLDQIIELPNKTSAFEAIDTVSNVPLQPRTLEFNVIPEYINASNDLDIYNDNSDDDPNYLPNSAAESDSAGSDSADSIGDHNKEKVERKNVKRGGHSNQIRDSDIENSQSKRRKSHTSIKERKQKSLENEKKKHEVIAPCKDTCQKKSTSKFSEIWRKELNTQYWNMTWIEKRILVSNSVSRGDVKRRRTSGKSQRNNTFAYYMKTNSGEKAEVCKTFFLTTLGYKPKNDRIITYTFKLQDASGTQILPTGNRRGKHRKTPTIDRDLIKEHVQTFHPSVSHYRREHAPNKRYLPSDITIKLMHGHFLEAYPNTKVSYEFYRKIVTDDMNISFTTLGHEECELCETFKLHNPEHTSKNLILTCDECIRWEEHINKAKEARVKYREDAEFDFDKNTVCFSADLEKVIMLPRIDMFKKALFCQRLIVFNESFVPVGKKQNLKPFAVLWHEAISGRKKEDLISTFHAFLLLTRDMEEIIIWMDNCAGQNKNWTLFTYLIYIINSTEISANKIVFRYFEPGHTFMAADSFHHQVELSLKQKRKVYDFKDFTTCVQSANSGKVDIKEMTVSDFFMWPNGTSTYKIQNMKPRPYLKDIVEVTAERGKQTLTYKTSFLSTTTTHELNFLQMKYLKKELVKPKPIEKPRGITQERKDSVLNNLTSVMLQNRLEFWRNISVNNASLSLVDNHEDD